MPSIRPAAPVPEQPPSLSDSAHLIAEQGANDPLRHPDLLRTEVASLRAALACAEAQAREGLRAREALVDVTELADVLRIANETLERQEAALAQSEERYRAVVGNATEHAIITCDPAGTVTEWSPGAEAIFGWTAAEMVGRSCDVIWTREDQTEGAPEAERRTVAQRGHTPDERWHLRRDGTRVWMSSFTTPLRQGGAPGFLKILRDRTVRRETEERLRESEERLRGFAENSADVLWIVDGSGTHLEYLSPAFERMFGERRERVLADLGHWRDLVHPDDLPGASASMPHTMAGETVVVHYRVIRPDDGRIVYLRDTGFPIRGPDGAIARVAGIVQDVTDLAVAAEALEAEKERFRSLAEGIPQLVWRSHDEGRWTWASPQWCAFTGQTQEESSGWGWLDAIHLDDRARTHEAWHGARPHGQLEVKHRVWCVADGTWRWHQTRSLPVRGAPTSAEPEGRILEWLGTTTDIHDMKQLQGQQAVLLAELQHRTRNILAIVQAVAVRSLPSGPEQTEFGGRLAAMGRVQGFLARSSAWSVSLHDLVCAELKALGNGGSEKAMVAGPAVDLLGNKAQPLALALHELATNAVKYGALAQAGARLSVTWRFEGNSLVLDWEETGVVMPSGPPSRQGYGSELLQRALPYQLGADTQLEYGPDGVRCRIRLPLPATKVERA